MKNMKKTILILLCLSMLLPSCSEKPEETEQKENSPAQDAVQTEETAELTEEERLYLEQQKALEVLPDCSFDGHTFTILTSNHTHPEWQIWKNRDIDAEEITGETINDAVFERNSWVEDTYDCEITEHKGDVGNDVRTSNRAGDNAYDVALPMMSSGMDLAADGALFNLNLIDGIGLENPWWDQNANESLSILHKLYFTSGDMLILNNDSTGALVFNKKLVDMWNLENPYELVKEGKWTFDTLYSQISGLGQDLNNDGVMNGQDQFGLMLYADMQHCMYHGAGMDYASKDAEDIPVMTHTTEQSINVLTRVFEIMNDSNIAYSLHNAYNEGFTDAFDWAEKIFQADRVLYYWLRLRDVEGMREMESDFGILPMPKWDEAQDEYRSTVNYYVSCSIAIPLCTYDAEKTAQLLNILNAKSKYVLQPAYYDITLTGKYARDVESIEMLDIIFGNRVYDIGMFGNFGNITVDLKEMLIDDNRNFASKFKGSERLLGKQVEKLVKNYNKIDY